MLTCPFCNAIQSAPDGASIGQRLTCSRCGESYALAHLPGSAITTPPHAALAPVAAPTNPRARNRALAGTILGVMLLMGGIGLAYALKTQDFRRQNDKSLPRKARPFGRVEQPQGGPMPPAQYPALGYLPTATNVLLGADVFELTRQAGDLLQQPLAIGKMKVRPEQVGEWVGLETRQIDHLLIGSTFRAGAEADLMPPVTIIVRTAQDYDADAVRKAMKATQKVTSASADGVNRTHYAAKLGALPVRLWQPDARTIVLGLFDNELKSVPGKPHEGASQLPSAVREALANRLPGTPTVWAVGHSTDWSKTWLPTLLAGLKDVPLTDQLAKVRTVALALGAEGKLLWQVQAVDAPAAEALEAKALAPQLKARPGTFSYRREADWLRVEMRIASGPKGP